MSEPLNSQPGTGTADRALADLVAEITDRLHAGQSVNLDEYITRHPEFADRLKTLLPSLELLHACGSAPSNGPAAEPCHGTLGDFRLIREVGRGGMGIVYEAEQVSLGRRVALKVLPFAATMDSRQLQRFKNEAHAAAQLHHTNIVPVYSVGCERGVHFYAMQYIEGQSLADVIADLRRQTAPTSPSPLAGAGRSSLSPLAGAGRSSPSPLAEEGRGGGETTPYTPPSQPSPIQGEGVANQARDTKPVAALSTVGSTKDAAYFRAVAELGIQAAEALDFAHERGVIHRDIKPANLMVESAPLAPPGRGVGGEGPRLWVTDFGLAQVQGDARMTMTGDLVGTLRYMSPEQALAKRVVVDHRTDIYSLGATLYELLALEPAYRGNDRQELLRQISFEEPKRPRRLSKAIPPELETIVLKAMEKNPVERYATAKEMAEDLRCFVIDKPIRAKRPSIVLRVRKWGRRNQAAVAAGLGFLVLAVMVLACSTVVIWRAKDSETAAREQAEEAQQQAMDALSATTDDVVEKLIGTKKSLGPAEKEFLECALRRWQMFAAAQGEGDLAKYIRAEGVFRVASLQAKLGENEKGLAGFQEAIAMNAQLAADFPDVPLYRGHLAQSHHNVGILLLYLGQHANAEAAFRKALAIEEKLAADYPAEPQYRQDLAKHHGILGALLTRLGKGAAAEAADRQAIAIQEKLVADYPAVPNFRDELAGSHHNLGKLLQDLGQHANAEEAYRKALAILEKLAAEYPVVPQYRLRLTRGHNNLGNLLNVRGQRVEAEAAYRQALAIQEKLVAEYPAVPDYRQELSRAYHNLGTLLDDLGQGAAAEVAYRQALAIQVKLVAEYPAVPDYRQEFADTHDNLGNLLKGLGEHAKAEAAYHQALAIQEGLVADYPAVPEYRHKLALSHNNQGILLQDLGQHPNAEEAYRKALAILEELAAEYPAVPEHRLVLGATQLNFGELLRITNQPEQALLWHTRAMATLEDVLRQVKVDARALNLLRNTHAGRATALDALKRHAEAAKDWDKVIELSPEVERPSFRMDRATSRVRAGQVEAAIREVEELTKNADANTLYNAACVFALAADRPDEPGGTLSNQECAQRAIALLQQAVSEGWKNAEHMKKDDDLNALRQRDDFRKLLAELENKAPAPPPELVPPPKEVVTK